MKKLLLITALAALTPATYGALSLQESAATVYVKGLLNKDDTAVFKSRDNLVSNFANQGIPLFVTEKVLPSIACAYYLHAKGNMNEMPEWLQSYFGGVSIQDLISNNMVPAIKDAWVPSGNGIDHRITLNLGANFINDLDGLQNIPDIKDVQTLYLDENQLSNIQPGTFNNLHKLQHLYLRSNQLPEDVKQRVRKEMQAIAPGAQIHF